MNGKWCCLGTGNTHHVASGFIANTWY